MSPRAFVSIVAAAGLTLVVALALIVARQVSADQPAAAGGPMFPELNDRIDDLARIEISTARYDLTLELQNDQWVAVDFGNYPVGLEPVLQIVSSVAGMTRVEAKTENPELYRYVGVDGVSPTSGTIRLAASTADGTQLLDAIFGNDSASIGFTRVGGSFVRSADEARTWLVEGILSAPGFVQEWFETLFSVPGGDVASITVFAGAEMLLSAEKINFDTADYELTFLSETLGFDPESTANDAGIRGVTQGIVSTNFDEARRLETVTFGDDARIVRFTTQAGMTLEARLGEADGEVWVAYTASAPAGSEAAALAADITARTEHWAFRIPSYRISALNQPIEALVSEPAVAPAAPPVMPFNPAGP